MIHGAASGETVKFVGSSTAHMTSPMRKSYVDAQRRWISAVIAETRMGDAYANEFVQEDLA